MNLVFLLIFGLAIISGLRFLGALLVGSLIIIPASASRQASRTLSSFLLLSSATSVAAVALGFLFSKLYGFSLGPTIVLAAAVLFGLSLLKKRD